MFPSLCAGWMLSGSSFSSPDPLLLEEYLTCRGAQGLVWLSLLLNILVLGPSWEELIWKSNRGYWKGFLGLALSWITTVKILGQRCSCILSEVHLSYFRYHEQRWLSKHEVQHLLCSLESCSIEQVSPPWQKALGKPGVAWADSSWSSPGAIATLLHLCWWALAVEFLGSFLYLVHIS